MAQDTAHDSASLTERGLESWLPLGKSADADLLPEHDRIAWRTRDLERNNPIAAGVLQSYRDNIVGHVLSLQPRPDRVILGWSVEQAADWARQVKSEFATYAESSECDAASSDTMIDLVLQTLTGAYACGDGLMLVRWLPKPGHAWATKFQVIESDRLDTPSDLSHRIDLRKGVEIDDYGAPTAHWIRNTHPGDVYGLFGYAPGDTSRAAFTRIPAATPWGRPRVIHLRDKTRPEAHRGRSAFTAVMKELFKSNRYTSAELTAAVNNAFVAAFIKSSLTSAEAAEILNTGAATAESNSVEAYWRQLLGGQVTMREGMIPQLPIGAELQGFAPGRPNTAFGGFMDALFLYLSAGLNVPREILLKDFSKTNYSSARAALAEAWRYFHGRRRWLVDHLLKPIYLCWMEEAIDKGRVEAPDFYRLKHAYLRSRWIFAGRGYVDPVKEANGIKLRLEANVTTYADECAEQGKDWEEVLEQRAYEIRYAEELGVPLGSTPIADPEATDVMDGDEDENAPGEPSQQEPPAHAIR